MLYFSTGCCLIFQTRASANEQLLSTLPCSVLTAKRKPGREWKIRLWANKFRCPRRFASVAPSEGRETARFNWTENETERTTWKLPSHPAPLLYQKNRPTWQPGPNIWRKRAHRVPLQKWCSGCFCFALNSNAQRNRETRLTITVAQQHNSNGTPLAPQGTKKRLQVTVVVLSGEEQRTFFFRIHAQTSPQGFHFRPLCSG